MAIGTWIAFLPTISAFPSSLVSSSATYIRLEVNVEPFPVLWAAAQLVYRTGFISLQAMDLSEIEIIEREKAEATWEKPLPWYRALF
jgi:hypothetical protein